MSFMQEIMTWISNLTLNLNSPDRLSARDKIVLKAMKENRSQYISDENGTMSIDLSDKDAISRVAVEIEKFKGMTL